MQALFTSEALNPTAKQNHSTHFEH